MQTRRPVILVVEDDAADSDLLQELLESQGYAVECAADGIDGLIRIGVGGIDLVLLDMTLPNMDGADVLRYLKAHGGDIPTVAMSASYWQLVTAIKAGARTTLPKPFALDDLLAVVSAYCPLNN